MLVLAVVENAKNTARCLSGGNRRRTGNKLVQGTNAYRNHPSLQDTPYFLPPKRQYFGSWTVAPCLRRPGYTGIRLSTPDVCLLLTSSTVAPGPSGVRQQLSDVRVRLFGRITSSL